MRRCLGLVVALGVFWILGFLCPAQTPSLLSPAQGEEPTEVAWLTDWPAARAQAREEGRPLLVVFR